VFRLPPPLSAPARLDVPAVPPPLSGRHGCGFRPLLPPAAGFAFEQLLGVVVVQAVGAASAAIAAAKSRPRAREKMVMI
jgi:hypothetical protein